MKGKDKLRPLVNDQLLREVDFFIWEPMSLNSSMNMSVKTISYCLDNQKIYTYVSNCDSLILSLLIMNNNLLKLSLKLSENYD